MVVQRQILRLSSHCSAFTLSNIRHFTPLRMTKCAAKYKYWRCNELACQSVVTSHLRLPIPSYKPPVTDPHLHMKKELSFENSYFRGLVAAQRFELRTQRV